MKSKTGKCGPIGQIKVGAKIVTKSGSGKKTSERIGAKKVEGPSIK